MSFESGSEQRNNALNRLKQQAQATPTLTEQQPNILYTMPVQTVERLENVLHKTLALQGRIHTAMAELATKESLKPLATSGQLIDWVDQVQELNHQTYQELSGILSGMREENKQAGKKREEFMRELSDLERQFQSEGDRLMNSFRLWVPFTIMGSAAAAVIITVLISGPLM